MSDERITELRVEWNASQRREGVDGDEWAYSLRMGGIDVDSVTVIVARGRCLRCGEVGELVGHGATCGPCLEDLSASVIDKG